MRQLFPSITALKVSTSSVLSSPRIRAGSALSLAVLGMSAALSGCAPTTQSEETSVSTAAIQQANSPWFTDAQADIARTNQALQHIHPRKGAAKNIILFVGDGMNITTLTASRIFQGQQQGHSGEENLLSFEHFPFTGLSKTYNVDSQTPDSAGTMSAIITGVKTDKGVISVGEAVEKGDCASAQGQALTSLLDLAEMKGKSTGVVSTARVTHATPAATYAKSPDRSWESDADIPHNQQGKGCEDIASQFIHYQDNLNTRMQGTYTNGIEVMMGGGLNKFLPKEEHGEREDHRNLIQEWKTHYPTGSFIRYESELATLDTEHTDFLFGVFNRSHMAYSADSQRKKHPAPSLAEMTQKAIQVLDNNDKGYFLMVEAGLIDHAHHEGNAYNALNETVALSDAVAKARAMTNSEDTLILVTADHGHVFTMAGYPKRGNPILGKVISANQQSPTLANDGLPYTTLGYMNGQGHAGEKVPGASRTDLSSVDTTTRDFHQEALVPLDGETHSGADVAIFADGPGAHLVTGVHEQNVIFHILDYAGGLSDK